MTKTSDQSDTPERPLSQPRANVVAGERRRPCVRQWTQQMDGEGEVMETMTEMTVPPSAEEQLVFKDHTLIHLHNGGYQWVDIQTFSIPPGVDDRAVIGLLIQHVRYRHSYASPEFTDAQIIHGPYWLKAITPDSFSSVSGSAAEALITTWANHDAAVPEQDGAVLDQQVYAPIQQATSCYQLAGRRATAEHDWGYVVGLAGFHEFVLVNRGTHELILVVASDD